MRRKMVKIIDCPRDAMQGRSEWIATEQKVEYITKLLQVGFDTLDCLSFVSPKAVPQMSDSHAVAAALEKISTETSILAIVLNERGATEACQYQNIRYLGFPLSISPTFQLRNGNSSLEESWARLLNIRQIMDRNGKEPVVYISMAFGNPYGDAYNETVVFETLDKLKREGFTIVSLADTVGLATPEQITALASRAQTLHPDMEIGLHLHTNSINQQAKLQAAIEANCLRLEGALGGWGGCPMAGDTLTGNLPTETIIGTLEQHGFELGLNHEALAAAQHLATTLFGHPKTTA